VTRNAREALTERLHKVRNNFFGKSQSRRRFRAKRKRQTGDTHELARVCLLDGLFGAFGEFIESSS